ncbi:hypothetical protein ACFLR4_02510 [Bacteroidota bacterium]
MSLSRAKLAFIGGALIAASGFVSIFIGVREGFIYYQPDPAGLFGHVGVVSGLIAIVIGAILIWIAKHEPDNPIAKIAAGLLTAVIGHLGAIAGALLVGTAGLLLSYIAGFWLMGRGVRLLLKRKA